jgi:hypothetical protein
MGQETREKLGSVNGRHGTIRITTALRRVGLRKKYIKAAAGTKRRLSSKNLCTGFDAVFHIREVTA